MRDEDRQELARRVQARGWRVATAESVTAGLVADGAAQAPRASEWFLGGLVAYATGVKVELLDVDPGPVVNARTAEQMARGAADLLGADVVVSTTGVGGPDPQEDQPPGTVWVGVLVDGRVTTHLLHLDGSPQDVCTGATSEALRLLLEALREAG